VHALAAVAPLSARSPDLTRFATEPFEVHLDVPGQGSRTMLLSARRLVHPGNSSTNILLMFEDVTEARHAAAEKDILLAETQHRMKNLLAVVRALITQTKTQGRSAEDYRSALLARLAALTDAQELILTHGGTISLKALVERSLAAFPRRARVRPGPDVALTPAQVVPLSFVLYELAANAAKYGAFSAPEGAVEITWTASDRDGGRLLSLDWVEADGPPVTPPDHQGFGSRLIAFSVTNDLGGTVEQQFEPKGLRTRIDVPLA
ncbi:sensor histidine kinase, partial [Rubellimicrobium roseum]|uniref:sensor histidine kinase n=1 Tax=Rubellimicrobium roseum TaxID=687525 RepID=UPI001C3F4064